MTQLPVAWHDGHLIVSPVPGSDMRALVDTGAPRTVTHRKGSGYLGASLSSIERMVGTNLDMLLGLDALSDRTLITKDFIEFNAARPAGKAYWTGSTPEVPIMLLPSDGDPVRGMAFIDTGAKLSYIEPQHADKLLGMKRDFYPPVGHYKAMQFSNRVDIGGREIAIEPVVPMHGDVRVTSRYRPLLIGSELFLWFDLWLNLRRGQVVLSPTKRSN